MTWRLLRALAVSRLEDITSEDSGLWDTLNRVLDDAVDLGEVRPLTAGLAVDLRSLTDRASRHVETGLTEETRARACGLLGEVRDRLRRDTLDIGLLRRLAWMTEEVAGEVLAPAQSAATSADGGCACACSLVASGWPRQWSTRPAPAAYSAASA
ncbi:hypothetical protein [Streptomyces globosus]|uniref:hypothetical protein n=1 Tax=Streptomyces globosus TaxID=68209 RepID=UPI003821707E